MHVSIDKFADSPDGFPTRELQSDEQLLPGVAAAYAATPVDGLYFFNFFGPRERPLEPHEPHFERLSTLTSDEDLVDAEKTYLITTGRGRTHAPQQLPLALAPGEERSVSLTTMDETHAAAARLRLLTKDVLEPVDLWIQLDDRPLGELASVDAYERPNHRSDGVTRGMAGSISISTTLLTAGDHEFVLRNRADEPRSIRAIEVSVTPTNESIR